MAYLLTCAIGMVRDIPRALQLLSIPLFLPSSARPLRLRASAVKIACVEVYPSRAASRVYSAIGMPLVQAFRQDCVAQVRQASAGLPSAAYSVRASSGSP